MHHAGAPVVSQPTPGGQHCRLPRRGQFLHRGKSPQETAIVLEHRRDAGLLQHDFREPHPVGIAVLAPRQVPPVAVVPREQAPSPATNRRRIEFRAIPWTHCAMVGHAKICNHDPVSQAGLFFLRPLERNEQWPSTPPSASARRSSCAPVPRAGAGRQSSPAWRWYSSRQKCQSSSRSGHLRECSRPVATAAGGQARLPCRAGPLPAKPRCSYRRDGVPAHSIFCPSPASRSSAPGLRRRLRLSTCCCRDARATWYKRAATAARTGAQTIAGRFFMGRILTAVVGRQSSVVSLKGHGCRAGCSRSADD